MNLAIKRVIKKTLLIFIVISFSSIFLSNLYSVEPDEILKDETQELRAREISKNVRCLVCQNQSIDDSNAPLAKDLRILIREQIKEKKNNKEIYKFLTDRYGDFILLKPPIKKNTFALWFLPFVFFIVGILIIVKHNNKFKF
jgi:cytochrome c-type biogenesis protein CcmH